MIEVSEVKRAEFSSFSFPIDIPVLVQNLFKWLAFETSLSFRIFNTPSWGGYRYFLEPKVSTSREEGVYEQLVQP